jgi:hypothetical protein
MKINGGYDDSPGAQELGLLIFLCSIAVIFNGKMKQLRLKGSWKRAFIDRLQKIVEK